jgi:hypothetical protein
MCAIVLLSSLVSDLRGSLRGDSFRESRSGLILESKPRTVNKKNRIQQIQQGYYSIAAASWTQLTEPQKTAWNSATIGFPVANKVGQMVNLTGRSLYIALNLNRQRMLLSLLTVPPLPQTVQIPTIVNALYNVAGPVFEVNYTLVAPPTNPMLFFYLSQLNTGGKNSIKDSDLTYMAQGTPPLISPIGQFVAFWELQIGAVYYPNQYLFAGLRLLDQDTGIMSGMATIKFLSS